MADTPEIVISRSPLKGLRLFNADRFRWLDEAAALGPVSVLRMGPAKTIVVTEPELSRTILLTEHAQWMRPPVTLIPIRVAIGENLFTQPEKAWAKLQPAVAPSFRRKSLDARLDGIDVIIDEEVQALPCDATLDFDVVMGRVALILAAWVMFGERLERDRADEIVADQQVAVRWVGERLGKVSGILPFAFGPRARELKRHSARLQRYADEVIGRARRDGHSDDDVLGALLRTNLGPAELRGQVLGLFLAGNETTATALSWALVHGAQHHDEWAKVRKDPAAWATAFIDETLRVSPAVWGIPRIPRFGVRAAHVGARRVGRSEVVNIYVRGMNRNESLWPDPLRFDPVRHLGDDKEHQRALIPFGLGPRGCIGQQLALAEMRALLPALARRGDVVIDGPVEEDPNFALRVKGGLRGRFTAPVNA